MVVSNLLEFLFSFNSFLGCDINNLIIDLTGQIKSFNSFLGCDLILLPGLLDISNLSIPFWDATLDDTLYLFGPINRAFQFLSGMRQSRGVKYPPARSAYFQFLSGMRPDYPTTRDDDARHLFQFLSGMRHIKLNLFVDLQ